MKFSKRTSITLIFLGVLPVILQACVSTFSQFKSKLSAAKFGEVICIANGEHNDWIMIVKKDGITIMGEEGGKVVMKGRSQIKIYGSQVKVANLTFTAPLNVEGNRRDFPPPIVFDRRAKDSEVFDCVVQNHCANRWARVRGDRTQIHHCLFKDKPAPVIGIPSEIIYVGDKEMHGISIHHNRLENYDPDAKVMKHKHDGAEGIYVKVSRNQGRETKDFATSVHHNYFHKIDAEQETIGIKSSGNEVYENAIEECFGGISLRHGKRNIVTRNYIQMRQTGDRDNHGITAHDSDHQIVNNWVMEAGRKAGIQVTGGNGPTDCNACHVRAKNIQIKSNVLVNSALVIGRKYPDNPKTADDYYRPPENIRVADLNSSCSYPFAMIGGTEVCKSKSFLGNPTTFTGVNEFNGPQLINCGDLTNMQQLFSSKRIIWKNGAKDLGDYGKQKIKQIKCGAGPSWYKGC
ncbi:uncharacterized protein LOC135685617 [Rhopilema esculentum]|uniref:uncharacterized protein LOC135685617 n=1 Tax=Rhopilema esculentum TaxID=499914 RepID=UPI0031E1D21C|eukprot:gene17309-8888_t